MVCACSCLRSGTLCALEFYVDVGRTALTLEVRFSAEEACSVLATECVSLTSLRLGVELLLRLVKTLT